MTYKTQKIFSAFLVACAVVLTLQSLLYIINLNQVQIFLTVALVGWLYLWVNITFLYDLHYKNVSTPEKAYSRFSHLFTMHALKSALNYLMLPGFIYWSTVLVFYLEQAHNPVQQSFAWISTAALVVNFLYLKEVFYRKSEAHDEDIFVMLSVLKIYAAALVFGTGLAMFRRFCLDPSLFVDGSFAVSFLLVYQALYQHRKITTHNVLWTLLIGLLQATVGYFVYVYWAYNYFTGAILLTVTYNLFWGVLHYHLDQALTRRALVEIILFSILIGSMVFGVTNFKARIGGECFGPYTQIAP